MCFEGLLWLKIVLWHTMALLLLEKVWKWEYPRRLKPEWRYVKRYLSSINLLSITHLREYVTRVSGAIWVKTSFVQLATKKR